MIDRRTYFHMLDDFDDVEFIGQQILKNMNADELNSRFGVEDTNRLPRPGHLPLHWRKNPGYDEQGNLVCAGCGSPMTVAFSEKDGNTHAVCATGGCELYGRDYVGGSERRNPARS